MTDEGTQGQDNETQDAGEQEKVALGESGSKGIAACLLGPIALAIVGYSFAQGDFDGIASVSLAVGAGAFGLGALLGFLFGVPKMGKEIQPVGAEGKLKYSPNTNLEEVSDWLTKIIIGATLVELGELVNSIGNLADTLAPALGADNQQETAKAYAIVLLVASFIAGFLIGYIFTRLRLQAKFAAADRGAFESVLDARDERDASFIELVGQQLDPDAEDPDPAELKRAADEATKPTQKQAEIQAKQAGDASRSKPVIEAIEEADS